jgi:hypothetical protein
VAELLTEQARTTCVQAVRTIYPHDGLPDEAYEKVVRAVEAEASADEAIAARLRDGLADLDGDGSFAALDADARLDAIRAIEGSELFKLLHATATVELYDNPLVWKAFGYEGPSTQLGGYVDRGFADLDWLPDPPLALDPAAGSHHT